ncbi:MAG: 4Fe-4S binding protein [Syntrophothermus sp.]
MKSGVRMKGALRYFILLMLLLYVVNAAAVQRFPMPEFESAYQHPQTLLSPGRADFMVYVDIFMLLTALGVVSWLVIRKRSRKGIFIASLFSLIYFGFYREGCVCSIGAIQNVTLALFNGGYTIPIAALMFFLLPLFFTLFFGRTFCAGVCPFGAMQDLVAFKPQKMGTTLKTILGLFPFLYLGFAVLYAATGTDFIICRYDPFVGFFRFNASFGMFVFGGIMLLCGVFIARPYCRFLCPYGVILGWVSRFSIKHISITPSKCIDCKLCEDSCPYEAINIPSVKKNPVAPGVRRKQFITVLTIIPVLVVLLGFLGSRLNESFAIVNPAVVLSKDISDPVKMLPENETQAIKAFKSSGKSTEEVVAEAGLIIEKFRTGGWILGGFIGLVTGILVVSSFIHRYRTIYEPDKGQCLSCARCVDYCPVKS